DVRRADVPDLVQEPRIVVGRGLRVETERDAAVNGGLRRARRDLRRPDACPGLPGADLRTLERGRVPHGILLEAEPRASFREQGLREELAVVADRVREEVSVLQATVAFELEGERLVL